LFIFKLIFIEKNKSKSATTKKSKVSSSKKKLIKSDKDVNINANNMVDASNIDLLANQKDDQKFNLLARSNINNDNSSNKDIIGI